MKPTAGNRGHVGQPGHHDRIVTIAGRAIAAFAMDIAAPRADCAVGHQCQAEKAAAGNGGWIGQPDDLDWGICAGKGRPASQLAVAVISPAPDGAISFKLQAVIAPAAASLARSPPADLTRPPPPITKLPPL